MLGKRIKKGTASKKEQAAENDAFWTEESFSAVFCLCKTTIPFLNLYKKVEKMYAEGALREADANKITIRQTKG